MALETILTHSVTVRLNMSLSLMRFIYFHVALGVNMRIELQCNCYFASERKINNNAVKLYSEHFPMSYAPMVTTSKLADCRRHWLLVENGQTL